jgi:hypothetical protein
VSEKILLGFWIPTGEPVYLSLHHLAIFGMTQLSGKTTALEALISRSGLRAIAFKTKRGEGGFTTYNSLMPYYKPRADWQFVEGLVNVALGEKVKFEPGMRYAIMKVCRGRKDLKDIQFAARGLAKADKSAFMRSVYEKLDEYLEIVIPELEKWTFTETLTLTEGVNVMDLSGMRLETQHIVIASTIEYAFVNSDHVVVIIPEAWETIPQGKMTPVKWVAQQFIRKGAALGNYLWLDSQDIGGIDKTPLRQCDNWLMGRMKEAHEVERILKQLLGMKVPAEEIQTLPLGHFYAAIGNDVKKVYVLPNGVPEEVGRSVALGELPPECVRDRYLRPVSRVQDGEDLTYKPLYEKERTEREKAQKELQIAESKLDEFDDVDIEALQGRIKTLTEQHSKAVELISEQKERLAAFEYFEEALVGFLQPTLVKLLKIVMENRPNAVTTSTPGATGPSAVGLQHTVTLVDVDPVEKFVTINTENMRGKILSVAKKGKLDSWQRLDAVVKAVEEEQWSATPQEVNNALNDLEKQGLIAKRHTDRNYYCLAQGVVFEKKEAEAK